MQQTDSSKQEFSTIKRMQAHPLDRYNKVSSVSAIGIEHPASIRYIGMGPVWVEDEATYYFYKDGIADINFVHLDVSIKVRTFTQMFSVALNTAIEVHHGLNTQNVDVTIRNIRNHVNLDWHIGKIDGTDSGNYLTVIIPSDFVPAEIDPEDPISLSVFVIGRLIGTDDFTIVNLDDYINSTNAGLETIQELGDAIIELRTFQKEIKSVNSTTYLLLASDVDKILQFTVGCTVTVPPGLPSRNRYEGRQIGTSQVVFTNGLGVLIRTAPSENPVTAEQWSAWGLDYVANDEYFLYGKLELI